MSSEIRLTPTSYIVLGLIEAAGEATPYDLKGMVAVSLGNFWSVQHAQLYTEPERLAAAGLLDERREREGRRRKHYKLTKRGQDALRKWQVESTDEMTELRDLGLLKIFFGGDPKEIARARLPAHERKLAEYEEIVRSAGEAMPSGPHLTLQAGIFHELAWLKFWSKFVD